MAGKRKSFLTDDAGEVNPRHHHTAQLIEQSEQRKANKPAVVAESVEMRVSSFNRRKYVRVMRLANGTTYCTPISKTEFEQKSRKA